MLIRALRTLIGVAAITATFATPATSEAQIVMKHGTCWLASNPYCEYCSCTKTPNGTGSECWIELDTDDPPPGGFSNCCYASAWGGCAGSGGGSLWGFF